MGPNAVQGALASVLSQPGVIAIPKAKGAVHLSENLAAANVTLNVAERRAIEQRFPPPTCKVLLAMN